MRRRTRAAIALAGAAILALLTIAVWLLWPTEPENPGKSQENRGAACTFQAGQAWAYQASSSSFLKADLGAVIGGAAALQGQQVREVPVRLRWRLDVQVVSAGEDEALLQANWSDVRAVGDGGAVASGDDLDKPVWFRVAEDCHVTAVSRHREASDAAARTQQAALFALSFRLPLPGADGGNDRMQTGLGTCTLRHTAREGVAGVEVVQQLLGCERVRGAPKMQAAPAIGRAVFGLDAEPWLAALDGQSQVVLRREDRIAAQLRSEVQVRRAEPASTRPPLADEDAFEWKLVAAVPSEAQVAARQWPGLESMPVADMIVEVQRLWGPAIGGTMEARAFVRAWLQANPEKAALLLAALRDQQVDERVKAALYHVVGRFGGPAARKALANVLGSGDYSEGDRSRAALAMAALPDADAATVAALVEAGKRQGKFAGAASGVGHSATLALGMLGHEQREKNPALAKMVRDHLRAANDTTDGGRAAEVLSAIGNTGDPELLDVLQARLGDSSEDLRAKAAAALRLVDPAESAGLVAAQLAAERDDRVLGRLAEAAAMAMLVHRKGPTDAVISASDAAMKRAQAATTRRALVQLLGAAGDHAGAKAALRAAFLRGGDADTMRLIGMHMTADELMPPKK